MILFNILNIVVSLILIVLSVQAFGAVWGSLLAFGVHIVYHLIVTAALSKGDTLRHMNPLLMLTAYGAYCSPRWGYEWPTGTIEPIDDLDAACLAHDIASFEVHRDYRMGWITRREFKLRLRRADWKFMGEALRARTFAMGSYYIGLLIGFTIRVVRAVIKPS